MLFIATTFALGQVSLPRQSQREKIELSIGDTQVGVSYSRPNARGRKIWGGLVPFGEVWRAGADENTTLEFSRDVAINGKQLPAGKYGFHVLPSEKEAVLIFSKDNDKWGSFTYKPENDALRVSVAVETGAFTESLSYSFANVSVSSADVIVSWENARFVFTIDIGDVHGRSISAIRDAISKRAEGDISPFSQGASYVLGFQLKSYYGEAVSWLDQAMKSRETFQLLSSKARILAADGKRAEAIAAGEKAVALGKSSTPPANTADFERFLASLKAQN